MSAEGADHDPPSQECCGGGCHLETEGGGRKLGNSFLDKDVDRARGRPPSPSSAGAEDVQVKEGSASIHSISTQDMEPPGPRNMLQKGRSPSVPHAVMTGFDHALILRDGMDVVVHAEGSPPPAPTFRVQCGRSHAGGKIYFKGPGNSAISQRFHGWPIRGWVPLDAHTIGIRVAAPAGGGALAPPTPPRRQKQKQPTVPPAAASLSDDSNEDASSGPARRRSAANKRPLPVDVAAAGVVPGGTGKDEEEEKAEERPTKVRPSRVALPPARYRDGAGGGDASNHEAENGDGGVVGSRAARNNASTRTSNSRSSRPSAATAAATKPAATPPAAAANDHTSRKDEGVDVPPAIAPKPPLAGSIRTGVGRSSSDRRRHMPPVAPAAPRAAALNSHTSAAKPPMSRIGGGTRTSSRPVSSNNGSGNGASHAGAANNTINHHHDVTQPLTGGAAGQDVKQAHVLPTNSTRDGSAAMAAATGIALAAADGTSAATAAGTAAAAVAAEDAMEVDASAAGGDSCAPLVDVAQARAGHVASTPPSATEGGAGNDHMMLRVPAGDNDDAAATRVEPPASKSPASAGKSDEAAAVLPLSTSAGDDCCGLQVSLNAGGRRTGAPEPDAESAGSGGSGSAV